MTQTASASGHAPGRPRSIVGVILAFLGAIALTVGVAGSPAAGLGFDIDLYTVVRDQPGTETSLGSWTVPDELRGQSCVARSTPENNSSIHPGNDLRIVSGTTVTLSDVEGSGNPVTSVDQLSLSDQVEVILIMGPDGVYSAGLTITFDCPPAPTTTTTTVADTTTTTTTVADTTTTSTAVAETTTTTTDVGNSPPTTAGITTSSSTTTSSVAAAGPTTVPTNGNSPTTVATRLPSTGSTETMMVLGALLLLVGGVMVLSTRRENSTA